MIQPDGELLPGGEPGAAVPGPPAGGTPWESTAPLDGLAFATLWATGSDPESDGIFRLSALRRAAPDASGAPDELGEPGDPGAPASRGPRDGDGGVQDGWERFDVHCDPFGSRPAGSADLEGPSARMGREYGVTRADLEGSLTPEEGFARFASFVADRPLVVLDSRSLAAWASAHGLERSFPRTIDLSTVASFLLPGRLVASGPRSVAELLGEPLPHPAAVGPDELRRALAALIARALSRDEGVLAVLAHGVWLAWRRSRTERPRLASELGLVLALAEHPSVWGERRELFAGAGELDDGRLGDAVRAYSDLEAATEAARPRWAPEPDTRLDEPLPPFCENPLPLAADDRRRVDEIFQEHVSRSRGDELSYREGQHALAATIAERFGSGGLALLHAPTGTGKTLAYLVPTMIWALRNGVRVGVATYTRALQEQAMERDVPLAVDLLRRAGVTGVRTALLKGRNNYLCWRALALETPLPDDPPERLLAWTSLAVFALSDPEGDLDRFPHKLSVGPDLVGPLRAATQRLLRRTRAETGCCTQAADRDTCGAEAARRRAERSHLVVTNHAFALARREFFRNVVFDECEHLHDVAHDAFSHAVTMRSLRELLSRLWAPGATRPPLNRLEAMLPAGEAAHVLAACIRSRKDADRAREDLDEALEELKDWRSKRLGERREADRHSLFREFVEGDAAGGLLSAHGRLLVAMNDLSAGTTQLAEHLEGLRGNHRIRRSLDVLRSDLDEALTAVSAWIPRKDGGAPRFRRETFHDLETNPAGDDVLVARVLLPHEYLGRLYYPDLQNAALLSATTWLRGGFAAQSAYLGAERAANPAEDEERFPTEVSTFRSPEAFDYSRVLVAVPRDAPSIREGKRAWLEYVTRFLAFLCERSRGRTLALFTNADDVSRVGGELEPFFAQRNLPFWWQRMEGTAKEELSELFRGRVDSVLLGLDTFWYGADFPGETLEYVVIVRLPYGVPDLYHHAQCAVLGSADQRRQIYMPKALAKFRQGFGRLMRKESDRGCVFVLDSRVVDPRHRAFLRELPARMPFEETSDPSGDGLARLVVGDTDRCLHEAFAHMDMLADLRRRGLERSFRGWGPNQRSAETDADRCAETAAVPTVEITGRPRFEEAPRERREPRTLETPPRISPEDLPF